MLTGVFGGTSPSAEAVLRVVAAIFIAVEQTRKEEMERQKRKRSMKDIIRILTSHRVRIKHLHDTRRLDSMQKFSKLKLSCNRFRLCNYLDSTISHPLVWTQKVQYLLYCTAMQDRVF